MLYFRFPRFIFNSKSKSVTTGLCYNSRNRKIVESFARQAECDIALGDFDYSLRRYRPCLHLSPPGTEKVELVIVNETEESELTIQQLWARYCAFKFRFWASATQKKSKTFAKRIDACPYTSLEEAIQIRDYFLAELTIDACQKTLKQLSAACNWAIIERLIGDNPFQRLLATIKTIKKKEIDPFTSKEKELIISGFENHETASHYTSFVRFLFMTGCRTSEAIGLLWGHIDPGLEMITFCEPVVDGVRKDSPKTGEFRQFPINHSMRALLISLRPSSDLQKPVFRSPEGSRINHSNFSRRCWKIVLAKLPVRYRVLYNTRHTFITECLREGVLVPTVARWVGNTPATIYQFYAGFINDTKVPEL